MKRVKLSRESKTCSNYSCRQLSQLKATIIVGAGSVQLTLKIGRGCTNTMAKQKFLKHSCAKNGRAWKHWRCPSCTRTWSRWRLETRSMHNSPIKSENGIGGSKETCNWELIIRDTSSERGCAEGSQHGRSGLDWFVEVGLVGAQLVFKQY